MSANKRYEQCIEYECAQEIFTQLRAARSAWINTEEKKPHPNPEQIESWVLEMTELHKAQRALDALDDEAVATAIRVRGAELKSLEKLAA